MGKHEGSKRGFPGQQDDEEILLVFHQHPLVMRRQLIIGLLVILLCVLPLDFFFTGGVHNFFVKVAIFGPLLVLFYWLYHYIGWYYTVYIATDRRIIEIKQRGLFERTVHEYQLGLIQNINYHISGLQAVLFHYGSIEVKCYGGDLLMQKIYRPVEIHKRLLEIVNKHSTLRQGSTNAPQLGSMR